MEGLITIVLASSENSEWPFQVTDI